MNIIKDQMNRTLRLEGIPERIVSLVPSQTEFLHDIGLGDKVVGITKFCIHPDVWFRAKTRVGGTKKVNIDKVLTLQPDLVIGNKEENTQSDIETLEKDVPVWMSDIFTLDDSLQMMSQLGVICDRQHEATALIDEVSRSFRQLQDMPQNKPLTALYLIWKNPYLAAAGNTFIDDMLQRCGFQNFLTGQNRYPEWIADSKSVPDVILLSSEPYPFREKHIEELQEIYPGTRILLVDGEMFSWYGSRLRYAAAYFRELRTQLGID